ncbi:hypothetical protein PPROV_000037400 [Pycnococcus provasolii]|uniref:TLC domain-containing protein n=3 Tax=Pycnococcus provasolii TaxID=41880 RepID=A0A830H4S4_9CHLO|nr:hypothetical protein PPROV_000037400 [Pycnococcus provasolii]
MAADYSFLRLFSTDPASPPFSSLLNNSILSFVFFTAVTAIAYFLPFASKLERLHSKLLRIQFTNRVAAFTHAVIVVTLGALVYFETGFKQGWSLMSIDVTPLSMLTHDVAFGYFLYDFAFMATFEPNWLYYCHHVGSLGTIATTRLLSTTQWLTVNAILFGELTNPLQLPWEFARIASKKLSEKRTDAALATSRDLKRLYESLSLPYTLLYVLCRVFYAPGFTLRHIYVWYTRYNLRTGGDVPLSFISPQPFCTFVYLMVFITISVSWQWAHGIVTGYIKFRAKRRTQKKA